MNIKLKKNNTHYFKVEFSGVEKLDSTNKNLMHYDLRLKVR